jgi:hypothetical protein
VIEEGIFHEQMFYFSTEKGMCAVCGVWCVEVLSSLLVVCVDRQNCFEQSSVFCVVLAVSFVSAAGLSGFIIGNLTLSKSN